VAWKEVNLSGTLNVSVTVKNTAGAYAEQDVNLRVGAEGSTNQLKRVDRVQDVLLDDGESKTVSLSYDVPDSAEDFWVADDEFDIRVDCTGGANFGNLGLTDLLWKTVKVNRAIYEISVTESVEDKSRSSAQTDVEQIPSWANKIRCNLSFDPYTQSESDHNVKDSIDPGSLHFWLNKNSRGDISETHYDKDGSYIEGPIGTETIDLPSHSGFVLKLDVDDGEVTISPP